VRRVGREGHYGGRCPVSASTENTGSGTSGVTEAASNGSMTLRKTPMSAQEDLSSVLQNDVCVGCGGCAAAAGMSMRLDQYGLYKPPTAITEQGDEISTSCPMLHPELDEEALADVFLEPSDAKSPLLGRYQNIWAAHVEEGAWRQDGSSGGVGSWIAAELLATGEIDGVIHARPTGKRDDAHSPFFEYAISRDVESIRHGAHSHYHVVEISAVLREVREREGRYLFTGVPCMVKAVRRAQLREPILRERIRFTMALFCGHMKSVNWSLLLGWAADVPPARLDSILFRVKQESIPANAYYYQVTDREDGNARIYPANAVPGGPFNIGAMMPNACNYCDDVAGETADLIIGDAWLPRYKNDWRGKNMVICRHSGIGQILQTAHANNRIVLDTMDHDEAVQAQAGAFRQRREGLAYRLRRQDRQGDWRPQKRHFPDTPEAGPLRRMIYRARETCSKRSHTAFHKALGRGDLSIYRRQMRTILLLARQLQLVEPRVRRIFGRLGRK